MSGGDTVLTVAEMSMDGEVAKELQPDLLNCSSRGLDSSMLSHAAGDSKRQVGSSENYEPREAHALTATEKKFEMTLEGKEYPSHDTQKVTQEMEGQIMSVDQLDLKKQVIEVNGELCKNENNLDNLGVLLKHTQKMGGPNNCQEVPHKHDKIIHSNSKNLQFEKGNETELENLHTAQACVPQHVKLEEPSVQLQQVDDQEAELDNSLVNKIKGDGDERFQEKGEIYYELQKCWKALHERNSKISELQLALNASQKKEERKSLGMESLFQEANMSQKGKIMETEDILQPLQTKQGTVLQILQTLGEEMRDTESVQIEHSPEQGTHEMKEPSRKFQKLKVDDCGNKGMVCEQLQIDNAGLQTSVHQTSQDLHLEENQEQSAVCETIGEVSQKEHLSDGTIASSANSKRKRSVDSLEFSDPIHAGEKGHVENNVSSGCLSEAMDTMIVEVTEHNTKNEQTNMEKEDNKKFRTESLMTENRNDQEHQKTKDILQPERPLPIENGNPLPNTEARTCEHSTDEDIGAINKCTEKAFRSKVLPVKEIGTTNIQEDYNSRPNTSVVTSGRQKDVNAKDETESCENADENLKERNVLNQLLEERLSKENDSANVTEKQCSVEEAYVSTPKRQKLQHLRLDESDAFPLHAAATQGDTKALLALLAKGAHVGAVDQAGSTALLRASWAGQVEVVRVLLAAGANPSGQDSAGRSALHHALHQGHTEVAEQLVSAGAYVGSRDGPGRTPLHLAAQGGHLSVVLDLLMAGAYVSATDNSGSTPLHLAVQNGSPQLVEALMAADANPNRPDRRKQTALHHASAAGRPDLVQLLLNRQANVHVVDCSLRTPLHLAAEGHGPRPAMVARLLLAAGAVPETQDYAGHTALRTAAAADHAEFVWPLFAAAPEHVLGEAGAEALREAAVQGHMGPLRALLEAGVDHRWAGALLEAARAGHCQVVLELLRVGTDVEEECKNGNTALHIATQNGHLEVVKLLLKAGANMEVKGSSARTPLHVASLNGHLKIVQILLEQGAAIDSRDENGKTPLHLSIMSGHSEILVWLLEQGADKEAKTNNKWRAIHLASFYAKAKCLKILLQAGVDLTAKTNVQLTAINLATNQSIKKLLASKYSGSTITIS